MAGFQLLKTAGFTTLNGSWPWPWIGLGHTAYHHASLIDLYLHAKFHWNQRNFLWTDVCMYRHLRPTLLGRLVRDDRKTRKRSQLYKCCHCITQHSHYRRCHVNDALLAANYSHNNGDTQTVGSYSVNEQKRESMYLTTNVASSGGCTVVHK